MKIAVVGAHLSGLPLNGQLLERGATLVRAARTKPVYRLYALPGTTPSKPGLLRVSQPEAGAKGVELEVWELSPLAFASFVDAIPPPLGIGTIELEDGERVKGFLVESYAVADAPDITGYGGWRKYLEESSDARRGTTVDAR
jgi:allophanate hydrolase